MPVACARIEACPAPLSERRLPVAVRRLGLGRAVHLLQGAGGIWRWHHHQAAGRYPGVPAPVQPLDACPAARLACPDPALMVQSAEKDTAGLMAEPRLSEPRSQPQQGAASQESLDDQASRQA